jgi:hypothetical protein
LTDVEVVAKNATCVTVGFPMPDTSQQPTGLAITVTWTPEYSEVASGKVYSRCMHIIL